jgi:hypothetical protein
VARRASEPIDVELPRLLEERGVSLRTVAAGIAVNPSHLSRLLTSHGPPASAWVAGEIAKFLKLPIDYFGEYREGSVVLAVAKDPDLRDRVYDSLKRKPKITRPPRMKPQAGGRSA